MLNVKDDAIRPRSHSRAQPSRGIQHQDGLDYLLYRLKKEVTEEGLVTREAFVRTIDDVVVETADATLPIEEQHQQLYELFETFDRIDRESEEGKVRWVVLNAALHVILEGSEEDKIDYAFQGLDHNNDGHITEEEFLSFFHSYYHAKVTLEGGNKLSTRRWQVIEDHLKRAFAGSDHNKDGHVDTKEFMLTVKRDPDHPFCLVLDSFAALSAPLRSPRVYHKAPYVDAC